ncbi:MAG TPA: amino acid adenylation domain-containing protein [Pilimelia sp.]|nr:amino acid adenylation domain-containing protein [Pilimelia sp.]
MTPDAQTRRAPLSDLQYAYLLGELGNYQLGGPALSYEEYSCEPFDVDGLRRALAHLMARHEVLRAAFDPAGHLEIQNETLAVPLAFYDLGAESPPARDRILAASRDELRSRGPALTGEAPFRMRVFALDGEFRVQMSIRLLCMDGLSGEIFAKELRTLLAGGELPPIGYGYARYQRELRGYLGHRYDRDRAYWHDRLDSLPAAPELPQRRDARPNGDLTRRTLRLDPATWQALAAQLKRHRLTPTMTLLAAFCEVLRHWAKHPGFTINVMYGERAPLHPDIGRIIGNFSSTLLLQCTPGPTDRTFVDRARVVRRQLLTDLGHNSYGGVAVIRELNRRTGNVHGAVMPVVFTSMLDVGAGETDVFLELLGWKRLQGSIRTPQVSFDHQVYEAEGALVATWDTADDLYPDGLVDDMFGAYERLLRRLATDDGAWLAESFALTPDAQLAVRARVNDTAVAVPTTTLHGPVLDRVRHSPSAPAVITGGTETTYSELYGRAAAVASALRRHGVGPGDLVGVVDRRGVGQIAALLGVLLTGAAYAPVSPDWPARRRRQVVDSAGMRAILLGADSGVEPGDSTGRATVVPAPAAIPPLDAVPPLDSWGGVDPESLAYVIFTSGTTGTPKGVMIRHQSAANTILDINERYAVTAADRVLAVSDYTFDLSVYDVFGLLAAGGAVVVPDHEQAREVVHLHEIAVQAGVTIWNSVPAYLGMFVDFVASGGRQPLDTLRLAMVSGDWVPVTMAQDLATIAPAAACVSLGGATEASIWSNYFPVPVEVPPEWVSIPYGYPLRNQRYHVLDADLRHRPDWVPGELYIAGRGLADGYLGNPELTAAAFRTFPGGAGERIYRTGDWARYWPDGTLEFLGREDPQVKINGFRVELTEIETCILGCPQVTEAVVLARNGPHGKVLVAFVGAVPPHDGLADAITGRLRASLPAYMVPGVIDVRDCLPLTANGKVDRGALAARAAGPELAPGAAAVAPPETETERRLAVAWRELLDAGEIGVADGFFDRGGNSLDAAQLMNRVEREFGVRLPLASLYQAGTIRALATLIDETDGRTRPGTCLVPLAANDLPPLVLVHPVGGDVLCYRPLVARLAASYSVFGLHSPALAGGPPASSVGELAAGYVRALVDAVPDGVCRLAGWSLGGVVAYEMARQLAGRGRESRVVMIDPWVRRAAATGAPPATADLVRAFLVNLSSGDAAITAGLVDETSPAELIRAALGHGSTRPVEEAVALYRVFEANTRALMRYAVPPAPGLDPYVLEAAEGLAGPAGEYLVPLRASGHRLAGVRYGRHPGDHFAVVREGTAGAIATLVVAALRD